jgi:hypothetical protein
MIKGNPFNKRESSNTMKITFRFLIITGYIFLNYKLGEVKFLCKKILLRFG